MFDTCIYINFLFYLGHASYNVIVARVQHIDMQDSTGIVFNLVNLTSEINLSNIIMHNFYSLHLCLTVVKRQAETTTVSIPTSAPSCDDVQNNAAQACLYYTDPSQCSQCQFDRDTQCDGWTESVDNLQSAVDNRQWITDATDLYYLVLSVSSFTVY